MTTRSHHKGVKNNNTYYDVTRRYIYTILILKYKSICQKNCITFRVNRSLHLKTWMDFTSSFPCRDPLVRLKVFQKVFVTCTSSDRGGTNCVIPTVSSLTVTAPTSDPNETRLDLFDFYSVLIPIFFKVIVIRRSY